MMEDIDDLDLARFAEKYPRYGKMSYDDGRTEIDDLTTKIYKFDEVNFDDPAYLDLINRRAYLVELDEGLEGFQDDYGGRTVTIKVAGAKMPAVEFVEQTKEDVSDGAFELPLKSDEDIEKRLAGLKEFNREIKENEVERTKLLNRKITADQESERVRKRPSVKGNS